jgi:uncharacterized protein YqjF (DUF2071 family)
MGKNALIFRPTQYFKDIEALPALRKQMRSLCIHRDSSQRSISNLPHFLLQKTRQIRPATVAIMRTVSDCSLKAHVDVAGKETLYWVTNDHHVFPSVRLGVVLFFAFFD